MVLQSLFFLISVAVMLAPVMGLCIFYNRAIQIIAPAIKIDPGATWRVREWVCPECGSNPGGCGYKAHRDRVGAINIISATVVDGNSLPEMEFGLIT